MNTIGVLCKEHVEAKYRFSDGLWSDSDDNWVNGAVSTLGENTFTVTGKGVTISFTDVYTEGGGSISHIDPIGYDATWAYLYDGSGKIGIVLTPVDGSKSEASFGKTFVGVLNSIYGMGLDTTGMQDTHNGSGYWY